MPLTRERRPAKVRSGFASGRANKSGLTTTEARALALSLPGTDERRWFTHMCVFAHDRFLTRVNEKEDAMVLQVGSMEMREMMLEAEPELFFVTDHYRNFPFVLARLKALTKTSLKQMLEGRARQLAAMPPPKRAKKAVKKKLAAPKKRAAKAPAKKKAR
jgi:hypothetical protein